MLRIDQYISDAIERIDEAFHQSCEDLFILWKDHIVFTWHWWVGVGLSVLPWIFWFCVRKKESTGRLLLGGFSVLIIASFLDLVGMEMGLWDYYTKVLPLIPSFVPWDFTMLPVTAMLFYQYKPNWNPYYKAAIFSAISSFIVQPVFQLIRFYDPDDWKHYYSFPIIFVIYLIGHFLTKGKRFEAL